jgi:hypothetical protein
MKLRSLGCFILERPTVEMVRNALLTKAPTILYVLCHGCEDGTFHQADDKQTKKPVYVSSMEYIPFCCKANITVVLANCYAASLVTSSCETDSNSGLDMRSNETKSSSRVPTQKCVVWCAAGPKQTAAGIGFLDYLLGEKNCSNTLRDGVIHEIVIAYPADMKLDAKPLASCRIVHKGEVLPQREFGSNVGTMHNLQSTQHVTIGANEARRRPPFGRGGGRLTLGVNGIYDFQGIPWGALFRSLLIPCVPFSLKFFVGDGGGRGGGGPGVVCFLRFFLKA